MDQRRLAGLAIVLVVALAGASCMPKRVAASHEEYFVAVCGAWEALLRAVGNPDTGGGSDLSKSLDAAIAAGDVATADRVMTNILGEFKAGREQIAVAAGWQPRAGEMALFDRVFVTFEAALVARLAAAKRGETPQPGAVEQVAARDAWITMLDTMGRRGAAATDPQCANVPVTP